MVKVVLLIALSLIVSSVQCAAACTPVSSAALPPCHHHKQAPKASCHELVPATTVQSFAVTVLFSAGPAEAEPVSSTEIRSIRDWSPPVLAVPPLTILRV